MLISRQPPLHLTYCLNVHPGESWAANLDAIRRHVPQVRERVAPGRRFGLGLRLSNRAARELQHPPVLREFKAFLDANDLYVFTVNGFPFGPFHGRPVKQRVYEPDWRAPERLAYTCRLAELLAALLPPDTQGSISTVPLAYKPAVPDGAARDPAILNHLVAAAHRLHALEAETGRLVRLGLEMEPDCLLERTDEALDFFRHRLFADGARQLARQLAAPPARARRILGRHLGICLDACHLAVQFEDPARSLARLRRAGIRVSKVQLSAALAADASHASAQALRAFCDPVYLHQVRVRSASGAVSSWPDLPPALEARGGGGAHDESWRVHCHVPLYAACRPPLQSTAELISRGFLATAVDCGVRHFEIETYTFHVLPPALRARGVVDSIGEEFRWVLARMGNGAEDSG